MIQNNSRIFTVSAVNKYIHGMFDQDYLLSSLKVEGEISNYKFDQRGHLYFSLKDETGALSCVMYKFNQKSGIKCVLENGLKCVVTGSISVYEKNGVYQLYAKMIEPKGQGDLAQRFEALKQRLQKEGLFEQSHKKTIPPYCKRIGVVTAATGAVIHDICNITARRNPYVQLILCPAKVQGEGAAAEIAEGIRILDQFDLDCIIVGRGGGSMEDLWAFNEEVVVRAVYDCETPVISAVGHQTDYTLCDFAADLRAPTPSAAAELAVFDLNEALENLNEAQQKLMRRMRDQLANKRLQMTSYHSRLQALHPSHRLEQSRQKLTNYTVWLKTDMENQLREARFSLRTQQMNLNDAIKKHFQNYRQRLSEMQYRVKPAFAQKLHAERAALLQNKQKLSNNLRQRIQTEQQTCMNAKTKLNNYQLNVSNIWQQKLLKEQQKIAYQKNMLDRLQLALQTDFQKSLTGSRHQFEIYVQRLEGVSPVKRLTGGYVYAMGEDGAPLVSIGQVQTNQRLIVRTQDGKIMARIEEKKFLKKEEMV